MHGRLVGGAGGGGSGTAPLTLENSLWTSWHDTHLIPMLNPSNILDYFSERTNPFYDRTCNNEIIRMQRQNLQHLENMVGIEYILLHVQGPILYVIRKQHRYSPTEVSPLADYYIIAGIVYQAPDLSSVINSRLLTTVQHLQNALEEAMVYSRYQQNKGYSWDFSSNKALSDKSKSQAKKKEEKVREEPSSFFQRQRVDMLLHELSCKYPIPPVNTNYGLPNQQQQQQTATSAAASVQGQSNGGAMNRIDDIKGEPMDSSPSSAMPSESSGGTIANMLDVIDMKPPPEKKMKLS